ncbi:hypothetical protein F8388_004599, partial [Cannabis sativa]
SSSSTTSAVLSLSTKLHSSTTKRALSYIFTSTTMSINLQSHAFAGNPLRSKTPKTGDPLSRPKLSNTLKIRILEATHFPSSPNLRKGRPLASSLDGTGDSSSPNGHLGWLALADFKDLLAKLGTEITATPEDDVVYWAIDVSEEAKLVPELGSLRFSFVELRMLMVATDWADSNAMGQLAVAGHARALWNGTVHQTFVDVAERKQSLRKLEEESNVSSDLCNRESTLVSILENDCALLSRQSRFVPRMWSCLAGFIEPGESLEEAGEEGNMGRDCWTK